MILESDLLRILGTQIFMIYYDCYDIDYSDYNNLNNHKIS